MAGIIYELIDVLKEEKECYEGLCTLANYKEQATVNKQLELLMEVVAREEEFAGRVTLLDKKRDSLLKDIAIVTGVPHQKLNITTIIEKLGEENEASKELILLRGDLLQKIKELKKQNELNAVLIEHSLELVNFSINAIEGTKGHGHIGGYSKEGINDEVKTSSQSFFDQKQ